MDLTILLKFNSSKWKTVVFLVLQLLFGLSECAMSHRHKIRLLEKGEQPDPEGFPFHPLDPLSSNEIELSAQLIRESSPQVAWLFAYISLKEPEKSSLLGYFLNDTDPPPQSIPRRSLSLVMDKKSGKSCEVVVDLCKRKIESWTEIPKGLQPIMAYLEDDFVDDVLLRDEQVMKRLKALGWTNQSQVVADTWFYGYNDDRPEFKERRISQVFLYLRNYKYENFYAHPVSFLVILDLTTGKILEIQDFAIQSDFNKSNRQGDGIPQASHNYDPSLLPKGFCRKDVRPISFSQPNGPGFKLSSGRNNVIEWQKFKMRLGFTGREGLILYNVNYNDNGIVRPLLYRASVSELFVPYGDPRPPYHRKMAFDFGHYGVRIGVNELTAPADCKGTVQFFDAVDNTKDGTPVVFENAVCVYEEDAGVLWKKMDLYSGRSVTVRSQRLVITFVAASGNYDYTFKWCFYQDASIKLEIDLNGIVNPNVMAKGANPGGHGSTLASQINGQYHQHFFAARLDTEIDGNQNTVSIVDVKPDEAPTGSPENPYGNGFTMCKTPLRTTAQARTNTSPETARTWLISGNKLNPVTNTPVGYKLIPENAAHLMMKKDSPLRPRGAFVDYNVWVTPYHENQFYAGGYYLNNSGLPEWVENNPDASIENKDIVLWHTFSVTHIPKIEDFPVMSSESVGFWLKPANFFCQNPGLDVPGYTHDLGESEAIIKKS